jgi:hypothetical protein
MDLDAASGGIWSNIFHQEGLYLHRHHSMGAGGFSSYGSLSQYDIHTNGGIYSKQLKIIG